MLEQLVYNGVLIDWITFMTSDVLTSYLKQTLCGLMLPLLLKLKKKDNCSTKAEIFFNLYLTGEVPLRKKNKPFLQESPLRRSMFEDCFIKVL